MKDDELPHGPLPPSTAHLCVDMQNVFALDTPWRTPWMDWVRPKVARLARHRPERTVFTRFISPERPEDATGAWRRYFERWRELTRANADPSLFELVPELKELVPPGRVFDKGVYSPFHDGRLAPLLREELGADTLVISGTETDVCVLAAVLDAVDHGFRVILAQDCLCSSTDETHDALMTLYRNRFGQQIEVAGVELVLEHWRA